MSQPSKYTLAVPPEFEVILEKLKKQKPDVYKSLEKKIEKILREPALGKPLRNALRNYRRIHIDPFVLIYEVCAFEVRPMDFDHHDKIYKKYKFK